MVIGKVIDLISAQPIEFAQVFTSDINGNYLSGASAETDNNGMFDLDANSPSYITARIVGYTPKTIYYTGGAAPVFKLYGNTLLGTAVAESKKINYGLVIVSIIIFALLVFAGIKMSK